MVPQGYRNSYWSAVGACQMSNPVATLFANVGSGFIRLPLAMGLVTLLVLCLFASGCETGPDHRERAEKKQDQRMEEESRQAVGL